MRASISGSGPIAIATAALLLAPLAVPRTDLRAQALPRPPESVQTSPNVFGTSDAVLATLFLSSLAAIEPLEGLDASVNRDVSSQVANRNTFVRTFGREFGDGRVGFGLAGSAFLVGHFTGNQTIRDLGLHTLETLAVVDASVMAFKVGVGRARPFITSQSDRLDPLSFNDAHNSFPSGHTAQAFALAATLSAELHDRAPWVPFVAYPLATWTATTRVLDREHWVTDLVGGAAVGILGANLVQRLNHRRAASNGIAWGVAPTRDGGVGLAFNIKTQ